MNLLLNKTHAFIIACYILTSPLPHQPLLHRPKHQPGMSLYPGFFHDGGAVAHEAAGADVELGGDIGTVGILAHETDDAELGGIETHDFQTGGIEKATTNKGGDFAGSGFAVIPLSTVGGFDGFHHYLFRRIFYQVAYRPGPEHLENGKTIVVHGECNYRHFGKPLYDLTRGFKTIHRAHLDIREHHIGPVLLHQAEKLTAMSTSSISG